MPKMPTAVYGRNLPIEDLFLEPPPLDLEAPKTIHKNKLLRDQSDPQATRMKMWIMWWKDCSIRLKCSGRIHPFTLFHQLQLP